jgi:uncharacterized protein with GYD domain
MALYMLQAAYTPDAWAALVKKPQNRVNAIKPTVAALGGKITSAWLSFGEYDIVVVAEFPDNPSAAAFSMAASAGGAVKAVKTTPLLTVQEGIEAMRSAGGAGYKPPTG